MQDQYKAKQVKIMQNSIIARILASVVFMLWICASSFAISREDYQRAETLREASSNKVFKKTIQPNWFDENQKFWYRNNLKEGKEFVLVDCREGTRGPAFDHQRLAEVLSTVLSKPYVGQNLPFDTIELLEGGKILQFYLEGRRWRFDLETYECQTPGGEAVADQKSEPEPPGRPWQRNRRPRQNNSTLSPDRAWEAVTKEYNLYLKSTRDSREFRISHDGDPNHYYGWPSWSPDSKVLVAYQIQPGENKPVYRIESSPKDGGRALLHSNDYLLPGDRYDILEMNLFFTETKERIKVDDQPWDAFGVPRIRWAKDGKSFLFEHPYRSHQRLTVVRVDALTGQSKVIIDERSETFVNINYNPVEPQYLQDTDEIIWSSERDGWRHLYLYDSKTGQLKNQITQGNWIVREIVRVDEKARTIEFKASGMEADRDPYYIQYYRIGFDGSGLVCLTPGHGTHSVQFSPDRRVLIDTYSRVDMPPVHELRKADNGDLICELDRADADELFKTGWRGPEPFCAKGRDGKTDIWGVIWRPRTLDESKKYPIIEDIYAGPQDSYVPKSWRDYDANQSLAELGFIVVQCDGMGTRNRSKAFHDVCWKNLADAGLPDRILWIKAAAAKYPYMDIDRVGIFGTSAGGQSSTGAVLFYPEFYKVAVSSCGCHDNRMDKSYWNEQWMGYPVGPHYEQQSNITHAGKLQGHLLLMVGELDDNVPPESTFRLADALIKAKKEFELVVLPGAGHTSGDWFGNRKRWDFFVRHLLGEQPPHWNAALP